MVSLYEARKTLGKLVDLAFHQKKITIITKNGVPRAAIVPLEMLSDSKVNSQWALAEECLGLSSATGAVER